MSRDYDFTAEAEGCNDRSGLKIQIVKLKYLELIVRNKKKKKSKNHVYKLVVALTVKLLTGRPISLKISKGQLIPLYSNRAH